MTPTQYQRMSDRTARYSQLYNHKVQLEMQLQSVKEHGPRGMNIEFVGITCKICLYKETSAALLTEIEKVYRAAIAECVQGMEAIDVEIGN